MDLRVTPWQQNDGFHQKCHIDIETFKQIKTSVGQCVSIETDEHVFLCSMWPKFDMPANSVCYRRTVTCLKNHREKIGNNDDFVNKLTLLNPSKAKEIQVTVILKKIEDVVSIRDNLAKASLELQCLNILQDLSVCKNSNVDCRQSDYANLVGISNIQVNNVGKSKHTGCYFSITSKTVVQIDEVHSEAWFQQMTSKRDVSEPGGMGNVINLLVDMMTLPVTKMDLFQKIGVKPPRGILLRGPPGCGKTSVVRYVAKQHRVFLVTVNGPEIFGSLPGETETNLRNIFNQARLMSTEGACVIFIDEIDSICPKRGKSGGTHESRATAQLLVLLDSLSMEDKVVVIAATNRPSAMDPALRRPGRLDREVLISPPDQHQRMEILQSLTVTMPTADDLDLVTLATVTNGYVGADLAALCQEASYLAMAEGSGNCVLVNSQHFLSAVNKVRPSLQKGAEGIVDVRPVQWSDIGGLEDVKLQIQQAVEWPLKHPEAFARMGLSPPSGVLLYGPPGCCKTTLVRAAATACHVTFLSLSGAQLYSPYVGESERIITEVFQKARACAPSILFLDELDSIVGKRSQSGNHGSVQGRLLSTLLNEMDGVGVKLDVGTTTGKQKLLEGATHRPQQSSASGHERVDNRSVLVVAATNRPDMIDDALLRPGRMDRIIYVQHPDMTARQAILGLYSRTMGMSERDLDHLAFSTDLYTGADLEALCREAALLALTEDLTSSTVSIDHFKQALHAVKPSLTRDMIDQYNNLETAKFKR